MVSDFFVYSFLKKRVFKPQILPYLSYTMCANMYRILFLLLYLNGLCIAQKVVSPRDTINVGSFSFEHSSYHFGDIIQGAKVSHEYKFKNTGKLPLVIANVLVTCGCTVPEWPQTPIAPNKTGVIKVFFNSSGKLGMQNKTVTILANTRTGRETIVFSANVIPSK